MLGFHLVRIPELIPGQVAEAKGIQGHPVCFRPFKFRGEILLEAASQLTLVFGAVCHMDIGEDNKAMTCILFLFKNETSYLIIGYV